MVEDGLPTGRIFGKTEPKHATEPSDHPCGRFGSGPTCKIDLTKRCCAICQVVLQPKVLLERAPPRASPARSPRQLGGGGGRGEVATSRDQYTVRIQGTAASIRSISYGLELRTRSRSYNLIARKIPGLFCLHNWLGVVLTSEPWSAVFFFLARCASGAVAFLASFGQFLLRIGVRARVEG